jgi:hypothetical protein
VHVSSDSASPERSQRAAVSPRVALPRSYQALRLRSGQALGPTIIALASLAAGTAAAIHYSRAGLALSHWDARAHLVVARRVFDNLVPSWQQIGAVWLPLPHLLNMLPVQVDAWYRSGASAIAISVASMVIACWALASFIRRITGSLIGGAAAAALLVTNSNLLYLQSTPMTEPLLFATAAVAVATTAAWVDRGAQDWPTTASVSLALACMTRYEAWLISAAVIGLAGVVLLRRGETLAFATRACVRLSVIPIAAIALFTLNSWWTSGYWFVPRDFYVPENEALGQRSLAWEQVRMGAIELSSAGFVRAGLLSALFVALTSLFSRRRASLALVLALGTAAALPWYAYYRGHPVRVRYGVPLVAACAASIGTGIGALWAPLRLVAGAAVALTLARNARPLDHTAPVIVESQRDRENIAGRAIVTSYLAQHYDGTLIMMSMGSLGHYMHDLSAVGLYIRDFLHEGNGEVWPYAFAWPRPYAGWIAIEERGEGGDALFRAARRDPSWLDGYERVAAGGGVALYRRTAKTASVP